MHCQKQHVGTRIGDAMRYLPLLVILLASCAVSPKHVSSLEDRRLCNAYYEARNEQNRASYKAEIERRNLISHDEWDVIDKKQVRIGMSVCALRASWGPAKENSTTTRYGYSIQHVYRLSWCRRCKVQYVYTSGGKVTAIQN